MSIDERLKVSPEVREVAWVSIYDCVRWCRQSESKNPTIFVNDFQQSEFARLGLTCRDSMLTTLETVLEGIERYKTVEALVQSTEEWKRSNGSQLSRLDADAK